MSLYIRVHTSFWTHRKTFRLRALIGEAALWVPPRLWCYAAENQPDGDFSKYLPEELAMLIGYLGDAQAMLEALQKSGFLDGMAIHGWFEHNSYHTTFSERAKKAADARWSKRKDRTGQERKGKEASIASSNGEQCLEHPNGSAPPLAEAPTEKEFLAECERYSVPAWYAIDKFLAQDVKGWHDVRKWRSHAQRVGKWYVNDGRPRQPTPRGEHPKKRASL